MILSGSGILRHEEWDRWTGIIHGFTTKATPSTDPDAGFRTIRVKQVHGCGVVIADTSEDDIRPGDALVTSTQGLLLTIATADCLPVLLYSPSPSVIAAIHCGWRGLRAEVIAQTFKTMHEKFGVTSERVHACFGPAIDACCFDVGLDVVTPFGEKSVTKKDGRLFLDLAREACLQLVAAGIAESHILFSHHCTKCDPSLFHSYRRDGSRTGRQYNFIGLRPHNRQEQ